MILLGFSVWLWLILLLDVLILIWCTENESLFVGAIAVGLTAVLAHWEFGISVFSLIAANPILAGLLFVGYIVAGVVWALPKWWLYVRSVRNEYLKYLRQYLYDNNVENWNTAVEVPDDLLDRYLRMHETYMWRRKIPVKDEHWRIMTWVVWWPCSMICTLIKEPFNRLYRQVWNLSKHSFEVIGASALGGVAVQSRPDPVHTDGTEDCQISESTEDNFELYT